ncbi:plakophilin-1-like, partial [Sinocyclocheilus grahami]|uniref:plakophilin-1-like n=1 Tax=Sinocyclocheilus grahami TaxID=75366 RepID=UPI0007ACCCAC
TTQNCVFQSHLQYIHTTPFCYQDFNFPATEKENPEGVNWLYHQKSLQLYLSLLGCSQNEATLEACCGALQNLTASKSPLSTLMSQSIIEKLQGLSVISPLLKSANPGLQKTTMSLVGNMSRVSSLRGTMGKRAHKNMWFKESVLYNESPEPLLAAVLQQGMKKDTFVNAVTATAYEDATRMKIS